MDRAHALYFAAASSATDAVVFADEFSAASIQLRAACDAGCQVPAGLKEVFELHPALSYTLPPHAAGAVLAAKPSQTTSGDKMKKRIETNRSGSLQTLGMILLMFFFMAFVCGDDNPSRRDSGGGGGGTNSGGGACASEEEFKAIITNEKTYLARRYEKKEVIFNSFDVEGPMHYENTSQYMTVTDDAYRVKTSFDVITRGDDMNPNKVYRERYEDIVIMFYPYGSQNRCQHFYPGNSRAASREVMEE